MSKLNREVFIDAPIEEVFNFVADTPKLVEVWPSLLKVSNWERLPNGGAKFDYTFMMAGIRVRGYSEDLEFIQNEKIVVNTKTGIESIITWEFKPEGKGTIINFSAEYKVPIPILGKVTEKIIIAFNELDIKVLLQNLKQKLEKP